MRIGRGSNQRTTKGRKPSLDGSEVDEAKEESTG